LFYIDYFINKLPKKQSFLNHDDLKISERSEVILMVDDFQAEVKEILEM